MLHDKNSFQSSIVESGFRLLDAEIVRVLILGDKVRLPADGLMSQSVVLWDRVCLEWTRMAKGRLAVRLSAAALPAISATSQH